ncbi:MAG: HlyD family efflux transporter periplasmic adaptor subunit [Planctomycetota bacterium]|nr:HlyD family efflux transporter periplasmic adaptor subunit [Planctomycetota bacterium]
MTQKVLVALSLLVMAVSLGGYVWQSKKIQVRTPLENDPPSSMINLNLPTAKSTELISAQDSNAATSPKLVQIDRSQSEVLVPTPISLTQAALIPTSPSSQLQTPSEQTLGTTQDGILRYKAILSFVNDIKVVAQTDGIILDILVDEGSGVTKDAIMIQIDNRLAVAEKEVAGKELESAKLKAEDDSQIKFSAASYEVATSVFNRSQDLFAKSVEAQEEWEKKRLEKIKAGFQIDVSKREQLINQAAVGVNEAKLNASNVQLELRTIKAPFSGVVASMQKERYDWVKAGEEILRLVSLDKFRVKGTVRIAGSPNTLEGARANVIIPTGTGTVERIDGVVGFVSPESQGSGARNDGTQEYTVWVEIPNKQVGGKYLFRGAMDAIVEIIPTP